MICISDIQDSVMKDFERLGISNNSKRFKMFSLKKNWVPFADNICPNLPELTFTCVLEETQINALAAFRKNYKFPTVTYVHPGKNKEKGMGCAIFRSSEPINKLLKAGSEDDIMHAAKMAEKWIKHKTDN